MKHHVAVGLFALSLVPFAPGCTQREGEEQPDAYVPLVLPDAAMIGDASMDAHVTSDTGNNRDRDSGGPDTGATACATMNLHSDIGASVATGTTATATDRHTPDADCTDPGSPDVWFSWTAPAGGGMFVATTDGSDYDTVVDVLTGCTGSSLACNDDSGFDSTSAAIFTVAAGQTVIIVVDGYGGDSGHFVLGIQHYTAEVCGDHLDNDGDGDIDCADSDCDGMTGCVELLCNDHLDNDGDGATDCEDFDCDGDPACIETDCSDHVDNDGDGDTDCFDFDCDGDPACSETDCANHVDDDGDGDTDCADFDCDGDASCTTPETSCTDGIDNDDDARIDCSDDDCAASCGENDATMCANGTDDDDDGSVDCEDAECTCSSSCAPTTPPSASCPDATIASALGDGVFHGTIPAYTCNPRAAATCGNTSGVRGGEIEIAWVAPADGDYVFDTNDTSHAGGTFDTTLSVRSDCDDDPTTELACDDDGGTDQLSSATVTLVAGQHVIIVISTFQVWQGGNVTLNVHAL